MPIDSDRFERRPAFASASASAFAFASAFFGDAGWVE